MHEMLATTFAGRWGRDRVLPGRGLAEGGQGRGQAAMSGATVRDLVIGFSQDVTQHWPAAATGRFRLGHS